MPFVAVETLPSKRIVYFLTHQRNINQGDWCIYQAQEGWEIGKVKFVVERECPNRGVELKKATVKDIEEYKKRERIARKAKKVALEKIAKYNLPMRLILTKYPLGKKKKIMFYYTAKERVDFRQLVKDLAKVFKVRIQMQQIGVRDEPQILGGIGICGREVCCASFLGKYKDKLDSVALEAARIQDLPLVSSKISGLCGRLRCCLNFEYPVYFNLVKEFPPVGEEVRVGGEKVKVAGYNVLKGTVIVETPDGIRKTVSKDEIERR